MGIIINTPLDEALTQCSCWWGWGNKCHDEPTFIVIKSLGEIEFSIMCSAHKTDFEAEFADLIKNGTYTVEPYKLERAQELKNLAQSQA